MSHHTIIIVKSTIIEPNKYPISWEKVSDVILNTSWDLNTSSSLGPSVGSVNITVYL